MIHQCRIRNQGRHSVVRRLVNSAAERWPMTAEQIQERQAMPMLDSSQIPETTRPRDKIPSKIEDL